MNLGSTCELYRLSDAEIEELKKLNSDIVDDLLDKGFACVNGKYHTQKDTVFPMDKGWGVTCFLIQECDTSPNKILNQLNERFIESSKVLESIEIEDLINAYDQEKLNKNRV